MQNLEKKMDLYKMNSQPLPTSFTNTKFEQLYDILLLIEGSDEYAKAFDSCINKFEDADADQNFDL